MLIPVLCRSLRSFPRADPCRRFAKRGKMAEYLARYSSNLERSFPECPPIESLHQVATKDAGVILALDTENHASRTDG